MTAVFPTGYVTILGAAEMLPPAMYAGVPDLPIVTKVRPRLETRLHCPKCGSRDVVLMFMISSDQIECTRFAGGLMQDDDWMLPRRFHEAHAEKSPPANANAAKAARIKIDPELVRTRKLREKLSPQPRDVGDSYRLSTEASRARCLAFRTECGRSEIRRVGSSSAPKRQLTGGQSMKQSCLRDCREIEDALARSEVSVFANTRNDPVPRELPAETWSVYDLVEDRDDLIRIFPASSEANYEQELLNVRLRRDQILERWPAPSAGPSVPKTTAGAANQCRRWLADMMRKNLNGAEAQGGSREGGKGKVYRAGKARLRSSLGRRRARDQCSQVESSRAAGRRNRMTTVIEPPISFY